jgi:hypothetical protein
MIASCPAEKTPEMDEVLNLLERIYEDGVVMPDEHDELMVMLKNNFQLCKNHCAAGVLRAGRARCQGAVLRVHQEDLQGADRKVPSTEYGVQSTERRIIRVIHLISGGHAMNPEGEATRRPIAYEDGKFYWNLMRVPRTLEDGTTPHPGRTSAIFVVHGIGDQVWTATAASLRCGFEDAMEGIRQWQDRDAKKRELRDKSWKE